MNGVFEITNQVKSRNLYQKLAPNRTQLNSASVAVLAVYLFSNLLNSSFLVFALCDWFYCISAMFLYFLLFINTILCKTGAIDTSLIKGNLTWQVSWPCVIPIIPMIHVPKTVAVYRLDFFPALLGRVSCHAIIWHRIRLLPDPSTVLFQARRWHARDWNDDFDDNYCLRFNVFSCCNLITSYEFIVYIAFSHVYFRRQKFSPQKHWSIWYQKPAPVLPENGVDVWRRFLERLSCVLAYTSVAGQWSSVTTPRLWLELSIRLHHAFPIIRQ